MLTSFFKYQSLGNDFIVFDWYNQPEAFALRELSDDAWPNRVIAFCDRHTGIGADGVLIITKKYEQPVMRIFNADGTEAENCLNGLRCVAKHLADYYDFTGDFVVNIGGKMVTCNVNYLGVGTVIPFVHYQQAHELTFSAGKLQGHKVDAGNPHFIVFQEVTLSWLQQHGKELESHADFPKKANVSFVWPLRDALQAPQGERADAVYNMFTFERGCGITQACSSGASAVLKALAQLNNIEPEQVVSLQMLGGSVSGLVNQHGYVLLQAKATKVFSGEF